MAVDGCPIITVQAGASAVHVAALLPGGGLPRAGIRERDEAAVFAALSRARGGTQPTVEELRSAVRADYALRNVRVLARCALAALREGEALAPELPDRLDDLAGAAELLRDELDRSAEPDAARAALLTAAAGCGDPLLVDAGFSGRAVVAQLRSVVLDLLQATGTPRADAVAALPRLSPS